MTSTQREVRFVFTWRDWVFGNNIIAGCVRMFAGIGSFILTGATLA